MTSTRDIADGFVEEAKRDYVGLWQVVNAVDFQLRPSDAAHLKAQVLEVVAALMQQGLRAVDLARTGSGCEPWPEKNPDAVLTRISREWEELGRLPDIGDIVWFQNPR